MKELNTALPSRSVMRTALRQTTERLAAELATPSSRAPDWDDFEWRAAMAASAIHGVSSLLAGRLRWHGSPAWQTFLDEQAEQGIKRERKVRRLLADLDSRARDAELPLLAMKGSALLRLDLYAEGERPMSDVDLLAGPGHTDATERLILAAGYRRGIHGHRHTDYEPMDQPADRAFGEHERNPIKIELHEGIRERLPLQQIDITPQLLRHAGTAGLNTYPNLATLMRHLLLHAAGNLCSSCIRLIQLHDIAVLAPRLGTEDWREALSLASDERAAWWAVPPLRLVQRLFPDRIPSAAKAAFQRAEAQCPPWLRSASAGYGLADMSLSRLGIPMLPGIEWSRGPTEALAFVRKRLSPGREDQVAIDQILRRQHSLAGSTWLRRPRWIKALSFVLGAPPRAQTLYAMHRALAYRPNSSA